MGAASGDALGFAVAAWARSGRRILLVVDEADEATRLVRALRFFGAPELAVVWFPADDNVPYDGFSPDHERVMDRIEARQRLAQPGPLVVVAQVRALAWRVPDEATLDRATVRVEAGDTPGRDALVDRLYAGGYLAVEHVQAEGQMAVRGEVVDVWGVGLPGPARIEFFDDEVEAVRRFEPETNRVLKAIRRLVVWPAREEILDKPAFERASVELARHMGAQERGVQLRRRVLEDWEARIRFSGHEAWLPALHPTIEPLDLFAGLERIVVRPRDVLKSAEDFARTCQERWEGLGADRPLVPPSERCVAPARIARVLDGAIVVDDPESKGAVAVGAKGLEGFAVRGQDLSPVAGRLLELARKEQRVGIVVGDSRRVTALTELFAPYDVHLVGSADPLALPPGQLSLLVGDLPQGFLGEGWTFVPATTLFGVAKEQRITRIHAFFDVAVSSLAQLRDGDHVVHRQHGIGIYRGIRRIGVHGGTEQDYVILEYRDADRMLLPVARLNQLSKFQSATGETDVKLDKLGGVSWEKKKTKVRDSLLGLAYEMLKNEARRSVALRDSLPPPGADFTAFENAFPYVETPDQSTAIAAIMDDLDGDAPMDRLICGDVGFGKTEVAMRATMRFVEHGRQVAILCPTTVLVHQHVRTFRERFSQFPVRVEMLSRFTSASDEARILEGLRTGSVDIVVGTTSLLGPRVRFKKLGLLVIDEEHRFGVKQKDRFKKLRAEVDVLSLSATPIPRTLQMALSGLRPMSLMATPPSERLSVKTSMATDSEARMREALVEELARGGQAFVVHNRIESLRQLYDRLRELVPEARFAMAHGQMDGEVLEGVMVDVVERRIDVLVCTAIVESGVDIPTVNTIIVHRADLFGLAQLYQLRGRVGRSNVRGRCLLLVPENVPQDAKKRLQVLVDHGELGSGFHIAAADLEMRGAGNIVGASQSGNIDQVGYDVWVELLEDAIGRARGERDRETFEPEVELPIPAFLPDDLIREPGERLAWYQRLAEAPSAERVDDLVTDLEAEFGELPVEARNFAGLAQVRLGCRELGITRCSWAKVRARFELHPHSLISEALLTALIARHPKRFVAKEGEPRGIELRFTPEDAQAPIRYLLWVFAQIRTVKAELAAR